jgi:CPA1 family monovalent cation:H+ antiporter
VELLVVAVLGIVVVALATALAPRVGIAGPLALVAIGIGVSLLPFFPAWEVNPEIILVGVLPLSAPFSARRMPSPRRS